MTTCPNGMAYAYLTGTTRDFNKSTFLGGLRDLCG